MSTAFWTIFSKSEIVLLGFSNTLDGPWNPNFVVLDSQVNLYPSDSLIISSRRVFEQKSYSAKLLIVIKSSGFVQNG